MKQTIYTAGILAAGLAGLILRAAALLGGYEPGTGLPRTGYLPSALLAVLTGAVIVCAVVFGGRCFPRRGERSFEQVFGGLGGAGSMAGVVCGALCAVSGAAGLLLLPRQLAEQQSEYVQAGAAVTALLAIMWALCLVSGASIVLLSLWQAKGRQATWRVGLCATLPMFWGGVTLVMIYHENSGNPVLSDYSYALLLVIAIMAAFYEMAGYLFSASGGNTGRFCAAAGAAVYLAAVHSGGALVSIFFGGLETLSVGSTIRIWAYLAAGIYLLIQLLHAGRQHE